MVKPHTLDDAEAEQIVAMELCDSVQQLFSSLPIVDLVCLVFEIFRIFVVVLRFS